MSDRIRELRKKCTHPNRVPMYEVIVPKGSGSRSMQKSGEACVDCKMIVSGRRPRT